VLGSCFATWFTCVRALWANWPGHFSVLEKKWNGPLLVLVGVASPVLWTGHLENTGGGGDLPLLFVVTALRRNAISSASCYLPRVMKWWFQLGGDNGDGDL
jgi:hypothetical protein